MRDCCRDPGDRSKGMNECKENEMYRVSARARVCRGKEGVAERGERMIETSNQSHCREQRAGRGLLPAVTLLSVAVSCFFPVHTNQ